MRLWSTGVLRAACIVSVLGAASTVIATPITFNFTGTVTTAAGTGPNIIPGLVRLTLSAVCEGTAGTTNPTGDVSISRAPGPRD